MKEKIKSLVINILVFLCVFAAIYFIVLSLNAFLR